MAHGKGVTIMILGIGMLALALTGAVPPAHASPGDGATPAGNGIGSVVVFAPVGGIAPGIIVSRVMILTPTPATGSLLVPMHVPSVSGAGPSITRYLLVIPGPNPAQNTSVSLGQQLAMTIGANGVVTVYPIPAP